MARFSGSLRIGVTDQYRRYVNHGLGMLMIADGDSFPAGESITFGVDATGQFAPVIASLDRFIEALQELRAEMLRQAVASDPAYANSDPMPCVQSGEHSDTIEHEHEYQTHTGRHAVRA